MILVDTSIWIDHFRAPNEELKTLLLDSQVLIHPLVIGELACGNLRDRHVTLGLLDSLEKCVVAKDVEAYQSIEFERLYGAGIGFMDVHLICACLLSNCRIWTKDKSLCAVADRLGLNHQSQA